MGFEVGRVDKKPHRTEEIVVDKVMNCVKVYDHMGANKPIDSQVIDH